LTAIRSQVGGNAVEIIIADGGSTDNTVCIAESFGARIFPNHLKTAESGKAVGIRAATRELLCFIDSDNILPEENWLMKMIAPFHDPNIIGAEPLYYTYRRQDPFLTRYCAILGMNDPICLYLGFYDRFSDFTGHWTGLNMETEESEHFITVTLRHSPMPTIGANGFFIRKSTLKELPQKDFLFDVDVPKELVEKLGHIKIAKVKTGIIHIYATTHKDFTRKQTRRIRDFFHFKSKRASTGYMSARSLIRIFWFCIFAVSFLPNLIWALMVFYKRKDKAVFYHPIGCLVTFLIYASNLFHSFFGRPGQYDRKTWTQIDCGKRGLYK